jgi:hypothetical protein
MAIFTQVIYDEYFDFPLTSSMTDCLKCNKLDFKIKHNQIEKVVDVSFLGKIVLWRVCLVSSLTIIRKDEHSSNILKQTVFNKLV